MAAGVAEEDRCRREVSQEAGWVSGNGSYA